MTEGYEFYTNLFRFLRAELILISALLFFSGLILAPVVVRKEIKFLLLYPRWVWRCIQEWLQPSDPFFKMVVVIFLLNATSLLTNIVSGFFVVLPFLFAFLVGLNVGVIVIEETGGWSLIGIILNPVAFLELPVTWMSLAIGMDLGLLLFDKASLPDAILLLQRGLLVYGTLILPLLLVAAFIEVSLIKWGLRLAKRRDEEEGSADLDF